MFCLKKKIKDAIEPIYFYLYGNWYKGKMPNFYDTSALSSTEILESNYLTIKEEILNFYRKNENLIKPNNTPAKYKEDGWKNFSLMAFGIKFPQHIKHLPQLYKISKEIPNIIGLQLAVLNPKVRVKAHFGDTNAIVRNHLGIVVPGKYPELGFRNGSQERCWEEGKVLAICISHRHYVWNNTEKKRLILIVDTIHPDYINYKYYVCSGLLASQTMKIFTSKFNFLKKTPKVITIIIHKLFIIPFYFSLIVQDKLNINLFNILMKLRNKA